MGGEGKIAVALTSTRILAYVLLAYAMFHLAMHFGKWYEKNLEREGDNGLDKLAFVLSGEGEDEILIWSSRAQLFLFLATPIVLAAALGGVYEALWLSREGKALSNPEATTASGFLGTIHSVVHYQFRPLASSYFPWLTVGEAAVMSLWICTMVSELTQGVLASKHSESYMICEDDPTSWCSHHDGEPGGPTPDQWMLFRVATYFGFICSSNFAIILVPVSRDSKIWSSLGVPFERAVLYHTFAGHLAFATLFVHGFLFVVYWVWYDGWAHAVRESIHAPAEKHHHGIDIPMGWMAALCALPMWITSINYVRRRFYSLFKMAHFLFIGVFVFGAMHWSRNTLYYLGGLALYTMHIMSRLKSWKRWRYWNRWLKPETKASPTSLISVLTTENYTRLVLRNPKMSSARGGSFVYISAPGALGTDEAHAITVALRGAPPCSSDISAKEAQAPSSSSVIRRYFPAREEEVFTAYIKELGAWTKALRLTSKGAEVADDPAASLLVDVDGFYTQVNSFNSMRIGGASRVVIVAGGSGMTSVLGFIQDWCVAAAEGASVAEVHLAWCCRSMSELKLVGEALPSLLARAGRTKDTHFSMSLYCSGKEASDGVPLSVTWPLDTTAYTSSTLEKHVISKTSIAASLNYSVKVILAGIAGTGAWLLGTWEVDRRKIDDMYHEGAIILLLQVVCIISTLIVYGWICNLIKHVTGNSSSSQVGEGNQTSAESKVDLESSSTTGSVTYDVQPGRVPTAELLAREAELAKKSGAQKVKVLTSGPTSMVDGVLAESRAIDWKLFDIEVFSFEL